MNNLNYLSSKINELIIEKTLIESKIEQLRIKANKLKGKYWIYKYRSDICYCCYIIDISEISENGVRYVLDEIRIDNGIVYSAKLNISDQHLWEDSLIETSKEQFDYYLDFLLKKIHLRPNNKVKTFFTFSPIAKLVFFTQFCMVFALLILSFKDDFYILKCIILLSNLVFICYWGRHKKHSYKF
jgi:hypothetical protein